MIRNILFDMGGVVFLIDTEEAVRRFRAAGIDSDKYLGSYGQKGFFLDVETGAITAGEFCRRMAEASGRDCVSWEEAQYCWLGFMKSVPTDRLHNLLSLREKYHVCLLSNTNPFIMAYTDSPQFSADGKPISYYFDSMFCSYEMGICKPDPEIFRMALAKDGMKAGETIFIDDGLKNVEAAESAGIHGLHLAQDEDWMPRLTEMLDIL